MPYKSENIKLQGLQDRHRNLKMSRKRITKHVPKR